MTLIDTQLEKQSAVNVTTSSSVNISVEGYPQALLDICKGLMDGGQYSMSVVVAHMACEVEVERALSAAFASKGIQYLEDTLCDVAFEGYSLANKRNRKLYAALTGDHIEKQPFWEAFRNSAERRNKIVHHGRIIGREEAERSYNAAGAFISHLKQHSMWEQSDYLSD